MISWKTQSRTVGLAHPTHLRLKSSPLSAAYMRQWIGPEFIKIKACNLFGAKPLSKPMLGYSQLDP